MEHFDPLHAISPIDSRYHHKCQDIRPLFSEFGLIRFRLIVEIALAKGPGQTSRYQGSSRNFIRQPQATRPNQSKV